MANNKKTRMELYIPARFREGPSSYNRAQLCADELGISLSEFIWRAIEEKVMRTDGVDLTKAYHLANSSGEQ